MILVLLLGLAVCFVAVSNQSFWIDETMTGTKARMATFASWWHAMVQEKASDLQMPLYMAYVWAFEKVFGSGEWVLRFAGAPWFLAGLVIFLDAFAGRDTWTFLWLTVVSLLCPFAWFYLDEARPYAMQLGASFMIVGALVRMGKGEERGIHAASITENVDGPEFSGPSRGPELKRHECRAPSNSSTFALFLFGLVVLCGSSLLGMVWAAGALIAFPGVIGVNRALDLSRSNRSLCIAAGFLLAVLAAYYIYTLKIGARASAVAGTGLGNLAFVPYELLGFAGLGPGRLELRSAGLSAFRSHWILPALFAACWTIVALAALNGLRNDQKRPRSQRLLLAAAILGPALFLAGAGVGAHFRVLGRHFTPVVPVLLLALSTGLSSLWSRRAVWGRAHVWLFCSLSLISCLALRFDPHHKKDDYRAAAAFARSELLKGRRVWWSAAEPGAAYYRLPLTADSANTAAALAIINYPANALDQLPQPEFIVGSKPDLYDIQGALAKYISSKEFRKVREAPAFVFWGR